MEDNHNPCPWGTLRSFSASCLLDKLCTLTYWSGRKSQHLRRFRGHKEEQHYKTWMSAALRSFQLVVLFHLSDDRLSVLHHRHNYGYKPLFLARLWTGCYYYYHRPRPKVIRFECDVRLMSWENRECLDEGGRGDCAGPQCYWFWQLEIVVNEGRKTWSCVYKLRVTDVW